MLTVKRRVLSCAVKNSVPTSVSFYANNKLVQKRNFTCTSNCTPSVYSNTSENAKFCVYRHKRQYAERECTVLIRLHTLLKNLHHILENYVSVFQIANIISTVVDIQMSTFIYSRRNYFPRFCTLC